MAGVLGRVRLEALLHRCSGSIHRTSLSGVLKRPFMFCNGSRGMSSRVGTDAAEGEAVRKQMEAAAREDRLDFLTAAKILFSTPSKPRKFGLDFHLWQFFVSLLPPFAVYLTAQYARYEIRRMEKERDDKEQSERDAALAKELAARSENEEIKATQTSEISMLPADSSINNEDKSVVMLGEKDFQAMKARLDAMEDKVRVLEAVRPGNTFVIPLDSEPNAQRLSTKEKTKNPDAQEANQSPRGEHQQSTIEKQTHESSLEVQNQKHVEVSQVPGRSWFGIRSKQEEKQQS